MFWIFCIIGFALSAVMIYWLIFLIRQYYPYILAFLLICAAISCVQTWVWTVRDRHNRPNNLI
jgi:hypothetical protein